MRDVEKKRESRSEEDNTPRKKDCLSILDDVVRSNKIRTEKCLLDSSIQMVLAPFL